MTNLNTDSGFISKIGSGSLVQRKLDTSSMKPHHVQVLEATALAGADSEPQASVDDQLDLFGHDNTEVLGDESCTYREHDRQTSTASSTAENPGKRIVGPLKAVNPRSVNTRWQLMEQLALTLPLNEYDLPVYIYRPDMLDHKQIITTLLKYHSGTGPTATTILFPSANAELIAFDGMQEVNAHLDAASVPLTYHEGFPVLPSGQPFWGQLDSETKEEYDAFINYLELGGARALNQLVAYSLDDLREWFHTHYWTFRVKAFDLYRAAHHQKQKIQRMMMTEDSHYNMAAKILKRVETFLNKVEMDEESLTPEKAVNMLEKLVKIQRISVGLPANGESKENIDPRAVTPVQVIMQQVNKGDNASQNREKQEVDMLLDDPEAIDLAQQLIIRSQQSSR